MALILAILELYSERRTQENYRKEIQAKKGIKIPIRFTHTSYRYRPHASAK